MPLDGTEVSSDALVLIDARGYLERGWCRHSQAEDAEGHRTTARHPSAVRWCLVGGLAAATPNDDALYAAMRRVGKFVPGGWTNLAPFNNAQDSVAPVLDIVEMAIADALRGTNG